jgi:hypothetical protein
MINPSFKNKTIKIIAKLKKFFPDIEVVFMPEK